MSTKEDCSIDASTEDEEELILPPNLIWRLALLVQCDGIKIVASREAQRFSVMFHIPENGGIRAHSVNFRDFQNILYDQLSQLPDPYTYLDHVGSFYVQEKWLVLEAHFSSDDQIKRCLEGIENAAFSKILFNSFKVLMQALKYELFRINLVVCSSIDPKLRLITKENAAYAYELAYTQNPSFATFHVSDSGVYKEMKKAYDALLEFFPGFIGSLSHNISDDDSNEGIQNPDCSVQKGIESIKDDTDVSDQEMLQIANEILPKRWYSVGIHLGLKQPLLQRIEVDNPGNVLKAINEMLHEAKKSLVGNFRKVLAIALYQSHHHALAVMVDPSLQTKSIPKIYSDVQDYTKPCLIHGELMFYDRGLAELHLKHSFWENMKETIVPLIEEHLRPYSIPVLSAEVGSLSVKVSLASYNSSFRLTVDISNHAFIANVEGSLKAIGYKDTLEVKFKMNGCDVDPDNCYDLYLQTLNLAMTTFYQAPKQNPFIKHESMTERKDIKGPKEKIKFKRLTTKPSDGSKRSAVVLPSSMTAAIQAGDTHAVKEIIAKGANLNECKDGYSPIHTAARLGKEDIIDVLVRSGAIIDLPTAAVEKYTALHIAAYNGRLEIARLLVQLGAQVDLRCENGRTALRLAAAEGYANIAEFLISQGADPNTQDSVAATPLHAAASLNRKSAVSVLVNAGADITLEDNHGCTPIHEALKRKDVELLKLVLSKNPSAINQLSAEPPLTVACKLQSYEVAKFLLAEMKANPNVQNKEHLTPLALASLLENISLMELLVQHGADPFLVSPHFGSVLHITAREGKLNATKKLLEFNVPCDLRDNDNYTPLRDAILKGQHETAEALLKAGASIKLATPPGKLPVLHVAARSNDVKMLQILIDYNCDVYDTPADGSTALHHAANSGANDAVLFLCSKTELINVRSKQGITPLYSSVRQRNFDISMQILMYNPDVNICSFRGHSPLLLCIDFNGPLELVKQLVLRKAEIHYPYEVNSEGRPVLKSPIELACRKGQAAILRELLQANTDFLYQCQPHLHHLLLFSTVDSGSVETVEVLLHYGVDPNAMVTNESITVLLKACFERKTDMVQALINGGAYADMPAGEEGVTPLIVACENDFIELVDILVTKGGVNRKLKSNGYTALHKVASVGNPQAAELLISSGAEVDIQSHDGFTPLHVAASAGNQEVIEVLLRHNANLNIQDGALTTPIMRAVQDRHPEVARRLVEAAANLELRAVNGIHLLHFAAFVGDVHTIEVASEKKICFNVQDDNGATPLHLAAEAGSPKVVETLISGGASVNIVDNEDHSPLHSAVNNDHVEVAELLMKNGANVNLEPDGNSVAKYSKSKEMNKLFNARSNPQASQNQLSVNEGTQQSGLSTPEVGLSLSVDNKESIEMTVNEYKKIPHSQTYIQLLRQQKPTNSQVYLLCNIYNPIYT